MCGIFGVIGKDKNNKSIIKKLASFAEVRGQDSSGILSFDNKYEVSRADFSVTNLIQNIDLNRVELCLGIGRLITNDNSENQPFLKDGVCIFHNGIIVNDKEIFNEENIKRTSKLDTEVFYAMAIKDKKRLNMKLFQKKILEKCEGTFSVAIAFPELGKVLLCSNHGSLYYGKKNSLNVFSSEKNHLLQIGCKNIKNINNNYKVFKIPKTKIKGIGSKNYRINRIALVPNNNFN